MKILLDEDVPLQLVEALRHVLKGHGVEHVHGLGWTGKKDKQVLADAARAGFEMLVTNDSAQLDDPDETSFIKTSGLHHVTYRHKHPGLRGLALALGSLLAALPEVVHRLDSERGQRLITVRSIEPRDRFKMVDPRKDPPRYWR